MSESRISLSSEELRAIIAEVLAQLPPRFAAGVGVIGENSRVSGGININLILGSAAIVNGGSVDGGIVVNEGEELARLRLENARLREEVERLRKSWSGCAHK